MHAAKVLRGLLASFAMALMALPAAAQSIQDICNGINGSSDPISAAGNTQGFLFQAGDTLTLTLSKGSGTATTAVWNLVGGPSGTPGFAGPAGLNQSLSYTITATNQAAGYYINSIDGTATMTYACFHRADVVPATSRGVTALLALLLATLAMTGLWANARRRGARR